MGEDRYTTSRVLNILDGIKQIENVVYIATTNYPEKLEERVTNRPSRFDRRYRVEKPSDEMRLAYFKHKIPAEDIVNVDVERWVKDTKDMSLAHLREVVVSVIVLGNTYEETITKLTDMKKKPKAKESGGLGFNK
jgi:SpoVK/Ycf46/Vps4 family AAA+-type ATPase